MDRKEVAELVQTAKLIPIMEAWLRGEVVQTSEFNMFDGWHDYRGESPAFTDADVQWRIKPIPRRWWIVECEAFHKKEVFDSLDAAKNAVHGFNAMIIEVVEALR